MFYIQACPFYLVVVVVGRVYEEALCYRSQRPEQRFFTDTHYVPYMSAGSTTELRNLHRLVKDHYSHDITLSPVFATLPARTRAAMSRLFAATSVAVVSAVVASSNFVFCASSALFSLVTVVFAVLCSF